MPNENGKRTVAVICGSSSDFPQILPGLALLRAAHVRGEIELLQIEACSTHRNPDELREKLVEYTEKEVDAVVACAGRLAALFGDADSLLRNSKVMRNSHTRVIAVPLKNKSEQSSQAAYLSAVEVPNSQLIFQEGFFHNPEKAFEYAINGPLLSVELKEQKPPESFTGQMASRLGRRKYPPLASYDKIIDRLEKGGLIHMYTGKTRETFINPKFKDLLFILATDRISIYDIVLNAKIRDKGGILTAMTVFWLTKIFKHVPNHLVAYGEGILEYLPAEMLELLSSDELLYLQQNMLVVEKTDVLKVEAIVRDKLTGSGLSDYQETGIVCGIRLPKGMVDGSQLPKLIFTPSTKADYGLHDQNISFEEAVKILGKEDAEFIRDTAIKLFRRAKKYLLKLGIVLADTKFEFGRNKEGKIILIDEVLTPDSSRFWEEVAMLEAMELGKTPPSLDKQPIRNEGKIAGIKTDNPEWVPPVELCEGASETYHRMFKIAAKKELKIFQQKEMGIQMAA